MTNYKETRSTPLAQAIFTCTPLPEYIVIFESYLTSDPCIFGSSSIAGYVCSIRVIKYDA
jgi:hypothetical protein